MKKLSGRELGYLPSGQRGSFSLEQLLFISGAIVLASLALPSFFSAMANYFSAFTETAN